MLLDHSILDTKLDKLSKINSVYIKILYGIANDIFFILHDAINVGIVSIILHFIVMSIIYSFYLLILQQY